MHPIEIYIFIKILFNYYQNKQLICFDTVHLYYRLGRKKCIRKKKVDG